MHILACYNADCASCAPCDSCHSNNSSVEMTTGSVCAIAAIGAAAIAGADAGDAQMLAAILSSPCVCQSGPSTPTPQSTSSVVLLVISPFSTLGPAWSIIGNVLLCVAVACAHTLVVKASSAALRNPTTGRRHNHNVSDRAVTLLGRWILKDEGEDFRRAVLARFRFPNLSITFLLFLLPGVVHSIAVVVTTERTALETHDAVSIAAVCLGSLFACVCILTVETLVYRHIQSEIVENLPSTRHGKNGRRPVVRIQFCLYHRVQALFKPLPRRVASVAFPSGSWEPMSARVSYGGLVSAFRGTGRRVLLASNLAVQFLIGFGRSTSSASCDILQGLTLGILVLVGGFIAVARPHRALLASILVCCSFILSTVTLLLGLLCCHGQVDSSTASDFGVFSSLMMLLFKVYHVGMPFVERWLVQRNTIAHPAVQPAAAGVTVSQPSNDRMSSDEVFHVPSRTFPQKRHESFSPIKTDRSSSLVASTLTHDQVQSLRQLIMLATHKKQ